MRGLNWFLFLFPRAGLLVVVTQAKKKSSAVVITRILNLETGVGGCKNKAAAAKKYGRRNGFLSGQINTIRSISCYFSDQHFATSIGFSCIDSCMTSLARWFSFISKFRLLIPPLRRKSLSCLFRLKEENVFFFLVCVGHQKTVAAKKKKLNWNWKLVLSFASSSRCGKFIFIAGERLLILEGGGRRPGTRSADGSERDMKFTSVVRAHVGEGCGRGKLCNWQREKEQQSRGGSRRGSRFFSF